MNEVIERCKWLVNKCEDKAITPDVKDDVSYLLEEIERLNHSLEQANKEIKNLEKHRDIIIKEYDDEVKEYYDIIKEAIDYVEHISNVDIDWHEQDRITNILRRIYKDE